jgi:hypothetical protein
MRYKRSMRRRGRAWIAGLVLAAAAAVPAAAPAAGLPPETITARKHVFGAENVAPDGGLPRGKVILSWFSVGSFAAALDGRVVLLDSYVHKVEDRPNYVPITVGGLVALRPEAIFIGHGHFDHGRYAGMIAARTGAVVVGSPEHCDQAREEASGGPGGAAAVRCVDAVSRGSAPAAEVNRLDVLGDHVAITAFKHVHSAAEPPDGHGHETALTGPPLPDVPSLLLHPPGPSVVPGLDPSGDEGGTLLYRFGIGPFSLVWHDSSGPLRERAPQVFDVLRGLPPTDVHVGAVLGFNEPTNGVRDPVDYISALRPKVFVPNHHDFISEYGSGRAFQGAVRRELARRGPHGTELRWIDDPHDYLRPGLMTYDVTAPRWVDPSDQPRLRLTRRCIGDGRLRVDLLGDVRAVRTVDVKVDKRLVARAADARLRHVIGRRVLGRTKARRLRVVASLRYGDRPRVVLSRSLPRCGLR